MILGSNPSPGLGALAAMQYRLHHTHPLLSLFADGMGCGDDSQDSGGVSVNVSDGGTNSDGLVRIHRPLGQLHDIVAHRVAGDSPLSSLLRAELLMLLLELAADFDGAGQGPGHLTGQGSLKSDGDERSLIVLARDMTLLLLVDIEVRQKTQQPQQPQQPCRSLQTMGRDKLLKEPPPELSLLYTSLRTLLTFLSPLPPSSISACVPSASSRCLDDNGNGDSSIKPKDKFKTNNSNNNTNNNNSNNNNNPLETLLLFLGNDK